MALRWGLRALAILLVVGGVGAWAWPRDSGKTLRPATTAAALRKRVRTDYRFRCKPVKNDGTIPLAGANYLCEPIARPDAFGYWVRVDSEAITALQPTGSEYDARLGQCSGMSLAVVGVRSLE